MKYIKSFAMKFVMTLAVLFIFLSLFNNVSMAHILALSLIISIVGFLLGDLVILPAFENWGATITDFFLVVITVRLYGMIFFVQYLPSLATVGLIALILSVGEVFLHIYINRTILNVIESKDSPYQIDMSDFQTEFGEEFESNKDEE